MLNEPVESLEIENGQQAAPIQLKTKNLRENFDIVISSVYARDNLRFLPEKFINLRNLLKKIETVDMAVINVYFDKDVLPIKVVLQSIDLYFSNNLPIFVS